MKERELLQRKEVPQASEQSVKKMTKVQEMLLKFDSNPKTVINVKTQAKSKQVETVIVEERISSFSSFGRQKTSASCAVQLNVVTESAVQKIEEDVLVVQKQEEDVLEDRTAAQIFPSLSNANSSSKLQRLLSQQFVPTQGQLQPSVEIFRDSPMERIECDDITDDSFVPPMGLLG